MSFVISDNVCQFLDRPNGLLIDGNWQIADSAKPLDILDPSTGESLCQIAPGDAGDVDRAAVNARQAFDDGRWRLKPPAEKTRILLRVAELIDTYVDEIAELEMLDGGKLLQPARENEIPFAAECFRYYAGWCTKIEGASKQIASAPVGEFHAYTLREPIGVVGLIVPWNGPLVQASWKLAPALAAGCSCVLKPDQKTPLSTLRLGTILLEAGIPPGIVNIVTGTGAEVGAAIVRHPDIAKVSFTGSTEIGKEIGRVALTDLKKVTLELGGKSPVIVLQDADLDQAIPGAAQAIFSHSGQVCVAGSRLYVEEPVYDTVIDGVVDIAKSLKVGPAYEASSQMGPLISEQHLKSVLRAVEAGDKEGARVATGGQRIDVGGGYFMSPTVMLDVSQSMRIVSEEIFGPVLVAMKASDMQGCLEYGNDSRFGLAASIWTQDIGKAHRLAAAVRAGLVWINCHGMPDMAVPFGGYKQSGWGRENGYEGLLAYTELKSVVCKL